MLETSQLSNKYETLMYCFTSLYLKLIESCRTRFLMFDNTFSANNEDEISKINLIAKIFRKLFIDLELEVEGWYSV